MWGTPLALATTCLVAAGCRNGRSASTDPLPVYEVALQRVASSYELRRVPPIRELVVISESCVPRDHAEAEDAHQWRFLQEGLRGLRRDTYDDFWRRNASPSQVTLGSVSALPVRLLPPDEYERFFERHDGDKDPVSAGWDRFHEAFPNAGGWIRLSAVGFSTDGNQALVYVAAGSGPLVAAGRYYLLVRVAETWSSAAEQLAWIS